MPELDIDAEVNGLLGELQAGKLSQVVHRLRRLYAEDQGEAASALLARAHGGAVDLTAPLEAIPAAEVLSWARYYLPALAHVGELSLDQATRLFLVAPRIERSYRGALNAAAVAQARRRPESMPQILEQVGGSRTAPAVLDLWAHGFAAGAPQQAAEFLVQLAGQTPVDGAVVCTLLAAIPEENADVHDRLRGHCQGLLVVVRGQSVGNAERLGAPWVALVTLAGYCEEAWAVLQETIRSENEYACWAACFRLEVATKPGLGFAGMSVRALVDLLTPVAFSSSVIAQRLDSAASSLLFRKEVADVVHEWVDGLSVHRAAVADLFSHTFDRLVESSKRGPVVLTSWLLRQHVTVKALHSLIYRFEAMGMKASLDTGLLLKAHPRMRAALPMRLLGLYATGKFILSIASQLAEDDSLQGVGFQVGQALIEMAAQDFPAATRDFLTAKLKELEPSSMAARMYKPALANIVRRHQELKRLAHRTEFRPSVEVLQAYRAVGHRFNDSVNRKASESSVFAAATVNFNVAQGLRFAVRNSDGSVQLGQMQEFTNHLEQPQLINVDPVGFEMRRRQAVRRGGFQ